MRRRNHAIFRGRCVAKRGKEAANVRAMLLAGFLDGMETPDRAADAPHAKGEESARCTRP